MGAGLVHVADLSKGPSRESGGREDATPLSLHGQIRTVDSSSVRPVLVVPSPRTHAGEGVFCRMVGHSMLSSRRWFGWGLTAARSVGWGAGVVQLAAYMGDEICARPAAGLRIKR